MVAPVADDDVAAQWLRHADRCLHKSNDTDMNHSSDNSTRSISISSGSRTSHEVNYADLLDFMQSAPPPPVSLQAKWEKHVWKLQDEPIALYFLRSLASSCGGGRASFLLDARPCLPFPCALPADGGYGLQRQVVRVVALRLLPSTTDVIQIGWREAADGALRPDFCSRTHVVVQLASGRHYSAWAYGVVGGRLRVGAVLSALVYASRTEAHDVAYVLHNVAEFTAADDSAVSRYDRAARGTEIPSSLFSLPGRLPFEQLVLAFVPGIEGQILCKSLLLLVAVHTLYRAMRCHTRQPLHLLLLGASKSGKSALLRAFLRLLGPHATLVGANVVHGQQRLVALSQAITATHPCVRQQLLLGGAVSTFDALIIDELSSSGCVTHVEGLMAGMCPIGGGSASPTLRGHVVHTRVQVTAAANDDLLPIAAVLPQFAVVARTTANLSLRSTASIGEGVIAASVARSQSSSLTPSRSVSLCEQSPQRTDTVLSARPLSDALLRAVVEEALPPPLLEAAIPAGVFVRFYLRCLGEHWQNGSNSNRSTVSLASQMAVLWELNLARLILESGGSSGGSSGVSGSSNTGAAVWNETLAEEVWQCYKHHLWTVDTAAGAAGGCGGGDHSRGQAVMCGPVLPTSRCGAKRKFSKKALCVALLRMMAKEQRGRDGAAVPDDVVRAFFEQLGGEGLTGQSFGAVIQQLLDAALIIRRLNAYAVLSEA
ncbi:hypothetical protein DQ04_05851040 [Trypanosoma grayi]|uniref:hypothetical protein n=1 Tax=Trypanosoma grayi TaxID=71804 RepID=UPI0004F46713|nr:hypothetical protein DQ04_05851040 [Trypanosoma grayi]KEG09085.1 hypothetical protein DQ04_05851040 [Trypanosoma grayi]